MNKQQYRRFSFGEYSKQTITTALFELGRSKISTTEFRHAAEAADDDHINETGTKGAEHLINLAKAIEKRVIR